MHWTYRECKPLEGLQQGDIIAREPLLATLNIVHKHFTDPKYLAFIVLTQSCDLVVHKKVCKAKHINLAVIRSLEALMPSVLEDICQSPFPGIYTLERRRDAEAFLHRVLNQNEQANGWVYLYPDADAGISEHAVAMLRISISLRAHEHYDTIRNARCGRLDTEYRNKLGWLAGNLYARVDTPDWSDTENGDREEKAIIKDLLEAQTGQMRRVWFPSAWITSAKNKLDFSTLPPDSVEEEIKKHAPESPEKTVLGEVRKELEKVKGEFTKGPLELFQSKIDDDSAIMAILSHPMADAVRASISSDDDRVWMLAMSFAMDPHLNREVVKNLKDATLAFSKRKAKPDLPSFRDWLAETNPFTGNAIERALTMTMQVYPSDDPEKLKEALASLKQPPPLTNHLMAIAASCILASLSEPTVRRLTNNQAFKFALKFNQ